MSDHLFDGTFVEAFSKTTGQPQTIPASWIGDPVLGADFELTPAQEQQNLLDDQPDEKWTIAQLQAYAEGNHIDLGDAKKHGEIFAAITTHNKTAANAGQE